MEQEGSINSICRHNLNAVAHTAKSTVKTKVHKLMLIFLKQLGGLVLHVSVFKWWCYARSLCHTVKTITLFFLFAIADLLCKCMCSFKRIDFALVLPAFPFPRHYQCNCLFTHMVSWPRMGIFKLLPKWWKGPHPPFWKLRWITSNCNLKFVDISPWISYWILVNDLRKASWLCYNMETD